jgi:hypothetical protein
VASNKAFLDDLRRIPLFAGCTKKDSAPETGNTLQLSVEAKIKGLDPIFADDMYSSGEVERVYDRLLQYHYLKRPYQLAFNAGITHEVLTGLTLSLDYFHSDFRNITVRQNSLRTAASYDEFSVVSPLDGSVIPVWLPKPGVATQVA